MEPKTFTTEKARNGTRLTTPEDQESMHFEKPLILSRQAVKLHRQAGQTDTGMDNSTPGSTQQRWKIEINQVSTTNKNSGFVCSLAHSVGFFPATQEQNTNDLERAPPSRTNLENVIFTDNSTITKATDHLKLTVTYNNEGRTKLTPHSQALANQHEDCQREFNINQTQDPTELTNACYTQVIRDQIAQDSQGKQTRSVVLLCDLPFPTQSQLKEHLQNYHGIYPHTPPQAAPTPLAQPPRALPTDDTAEVITKLYAVLAIAKEKSERPTNHGTPQPAWWILREHIQQFFEHIPMLFAQYVNVFERNTDRPATISGWLTAAWDEVKNPQQTHKFLTPPTSQEMRAFHPAPNRTTRKAISNVSQAGQSAKNQKATDTGNAPLKKKSSDDSLGLSEPRPTKTKQDETADGEKQGHETTPQVTNTRAGTWHGNAEHTDPDGTTSNEPKDQEALIKEQRTRKPVTMGRTSTPSIEDRNPQSNDKNRYTTIPLNTPVILQRSTPHEPTEEPKKVNDKILAQEIEGQLEHKTETAHRWSIQNNPTNIQDKKNAPAKPAEKGPNTEARQPKEIEVTISIKARTSTAEQRIQKTEHRVKEPSNNVPEPVATLEIKVNKPADTKIVPHNDPSRINPDAERTVNTSNNSEKQDVTQAQRTDAQTTDWYSLMLEDEANEDATPRDTQPYHTTRDATSHQQNEQSRKQPQIREPGAQETTTPEAAQSHTKPHPKNNQNLGQPRPLPKTERATNSDTTQTIMKKLEHIKRIIRKHPRPNEQCAIPILLDFLPKGTVRVTLTLLLTLCHKPGQQIPLDKLLKYTAAAWELTKCSDKPKLFKEILGRMASKTDTRSQVMKKYENFERRLLQFSTKFGGKTPPNGQRELTAIEWGWMHALLEAFMTRINSGKRELAEAIYQATGININQLQSSKRVTCGDLAKGIGELWESGKYARKSRPAIAPMIHPHLRSKARVCILEIEFIGTILTPRNPETSQGEALHVRILAESEEATHHLPQSAPINPQIKQTPEQPAHGDNYPIKKIDEAGKQKKNQPPAKKQSAGTIYHGQIYRIDSTTYKFLHPQQQEPITINGHSYLKIGTSQKGTSRQPILLDRENATTKKSALVADLQLLKERYKCPFPQKPTKITDEKLTPGQVYSLCSGATIRFARTNDKVNVGTVQQYKVRFPAVKITDKIAGPHPHANQDTGHLQKDTPPNYPTHTGSHSTHTETHPGKGHLENGHLTTTKNPPMDTSTIRPHQPKQQDVTNSSTKYLVQTTSPATQQPETENMKQRPDAADAGSFLRRQIKSPGDFSRSNEQAFLKYENDMDHDAIRNSTTARRLRKKAPSKISLASTIIRNTLLFHEDIQAGQCSRYQCPKPRTCFLARKSKQTAGSLYDSWKCYKPPPRREGQ